MGGDDHDSPNADDRGAQVRAHGPANATEDGDAERFGEMFFDIANHPMTHLVPQPHGLSRWHFVAP